MYLYEKSIVNSLNKIFTNSKIKTVIADTLDEGLRRIAADNEDKITLPLIVLSGGNWEITDSNFYSLMHGSTFKQSKIDDNKKVLKSTNIISITPSYSMYILAQSSRECDMLTREILFYYLLNPTLIVNIPYGIDSIHTFNLLFNNNVPKTQMPSGLVYRTLNFELQGAYLWHNNTFNIIDNIQTEVKFKYEDIYNLNNTNTDDE